MHRVRECVEFTVNVGGINAKAGQVGRMGLTLERAELKFIGELQ